MKLCNLARGLRILGLCLSLTLLAKNVSAAPLQTFVIVDPELIIVQERRNEYLEAFARRLEEVLKRPPGSLRVLGFTDLQSAEPVLNKERPAFALVAVHALAQLHKDKRIKILGWASAMETKDYRYKMLSRAGDNIGALPHQHPNLRLATHIKDMQWLNVIFDGMLKPQTHFHHVTVASESQAVEAVVDKRADVALIWAENLHLYAKQMRVDGLRVSFNSAQFPPLTVVMFKHAAKREQKTAKALVKALPDICKGPKNVDTCGGLGFHFMEAGEHEIHPHLIYKYESYK